MTSTARPYLRHKKPLERSPSKFVAAAFSRYSLPGNYPILDLACGYGRHTQFLDNMGYVVIAADYNENVFVEGWLKYPEHSFPIRLDAMKSLPFDESVFGAIVVVHYYATDLFMNLKELVVPGGYIVYESISARGGNWLQLPRRYEARNHLADSYTMMVYKERPAGPNGEYATLKMIAQRKV